MLSIAVTDEELSTLLASYKRAISTRLSHIAKRVLVSPTSRGHSLRKLRDFLLDYDVYFNTIEEYATRRRIIVAVLYIRKDALR
jgi:hypothetical protein